MRVSRMLLLILAVALVAAACTPADEANDTDQTDLGGEIEDTPADLEDGTETEVAQDDQEEADGTLQAVRDRGHLECGVNDVLPGFGITTEEGEFEGFDIDYCRAIAAAVLGDPEAVEFTALTAEARLTALQAREIDVLIRNTTWTATRDGSESISFATTTFYDAQGMMVRADSGIASLDDMENTAVCVLSGTTTELNLESNFRARGITYEPLTFEDNDTLREAFLAERCEGWTSDMSQLGAFRSEWPEEEGGPEALQILDETMSKEPLGPATLDGDTEWFDVVNWVVLATIQAEEFDITSENIDQVIEETDAEAEPVRARFLGFDNYDPGLGLDPEWVQDVIRAVGNYGEIYNRHLGPDTPIGIERGLNALWTEGGLHYPPPY